MFGRNEINLSASVTTALEAVRQALEVYHGCPIGFAGTMKINPKEIKTVPDGDAHRSRDVAITGGFRRGQGGVPVMFHADVEACDTDDGWSAVRAIIGINMENPDERLWCIAHWGYKNDPRDMIRIGVTLSKSDPDNLWRVGRDFTDRRLEPIFE